jgi:hypothetical protein
MSDFDNMQNVNSLLNILSRNQQRYQRLADAFLTTAEAFLAELNGGRDRRRLTALFRAFDKTQPPLTNLLRVQIGFLDDLLNVLNQWKSPSREHAALVRRAWGVVKYRKKLFFEYARDNMQIHGGIEDAFHEATAP